MLPDFVLILLDQVLIFTIIFALITFCIMYFVSKRWRKDYQKEHSFGVCTLCNGTVQSVPTSGVCDACYEADELAKYKSLGDAWFKINRDNAISTNSVTVAVHPLDLMRCFIHTSKIGKRETNYERRADMYDVTRDRIQLTTTMHTILIYKKLIIMKDQAVKQAVKIEFTPPTLDNRYWLMTSTRYQNGLQAEPEQHRDLKCGQKAMLVFEDN